MSDLYWLTDEQMARLSPYFPKSHGKPRVDDRRVLSGIIFVNRNGLRWRDAPREYGPLPLNLISNQMGWLPPSPDGIAMCQEGGVETH
jgi:transposase